MSSSNRNRLPRSIPVEPLRRAFVESDMKLVDVARGMGWYVRKRGCMRPDSNRVSRALGICRYSPSHGYPPRRACRVQYDTAVRLAAVIGVEPVLVGV